MAAAAEVAGDGADIDIGNPAAGDQVDAAAHGGHESSRREQPDPRTAAPPSSLDADERLEDALPVFAWDARPLRADGEQRNRGVELSLFGQPHEQVRLIGGLTYLDAEMTETQDGLFEGNTAVGSPDTQANFNVEWDIAPVEGLTLDARVIYTSSQWADAANTIEAPSWTRFDIGARYSMEIAGRPFTVRGRLDNVTDENEWVSVGGYPGSNYLVLGTPRTFILSASMDF